MSQHLPALRPEKVLKALLRAGFYIHHTKGSHHFLKHPERPDLRVTIAMHTTDLKRKTLASIIEQAGYSVEEFLELLQTISKPCSVRIAPTRKARFSAGRRARKLTTRFQNFANALKDRLLTRAAPSEVRHIRLGRIES
jgi:predicted RNA binding protein YcfA (HicA-like mRNA interferase family)